MSTGASTDPQSYADAAERLMSLYERWLPLSTVTTVVAECRKQLGQAAHHAISPLGIYQAANDRLRAMTAVLELGT